MKQLLASLYRGRILAVKVAFEAGRFQLQRRALYLAVSYKEITQDALDCRRSAPWGGRLFSQEPLRRLLTKEGRFYTLEFGT